MERPKLLIIAGPNGAGKTTVTSQILKHEWVEDCEYINPDFIARDKERSYKRLKKEVSFTESRPRKIVLFGDCDGITCFKPLTFGFFGVILQKVLRHSRQVKGLMYYKSTGLQI